MTPIFIATAQRGELRFDLPANFFRYLLTLDEKRVVVSVKKFRKDRTPPQLRYYWGVCIRLLSQHTGYSEDEMHQIVKYKFLRTVNEDNYTYVKSLSTIARQVDTTEMNEFLEKVKLWGAEIGCFIPDPETTE